MRESIKNVRVVDESKLERERESIMNVRVVDDTK